MKTATSKKTLKFVNENLYNCSSNYFSNTTDLRLPLPQRFQKTFAYKSKH